MGGVKQSGEERTETGTLKGNTAACFLRTVPTIVSYCAYVPRISRYSGFRRSFLSVMLTNTVTVTVIFLRSLKLSGESRS